MQHIHIKDLDNNTGLREPLYLSKLIDGNVLGENPICCCISSSCPEVVLIFDLDVRTDVWIRDAPLTHLKLIDTSNNLINLRLDSILIKETLILENISNKVFLKNCHINTCIIETKLILLLNLQNTLVQTLSCNVELVRVVSNKLVSYPLKIHKIPKFEVIAYKVLKDDKIATLQILSRWVEDIDTGKCKCSKAKVLHITDLKYGFIYNKGTSLYDDKFIYEVNKIVNVPIPVLDYNQVCSKGIHFFLTKEGAINYYNNTL